MICVFQICVLLAHMRPKKHSPTLSPPVQAPFYSAIFPKINQSLSIIKAIVDISLANR